MVRMPRWSTFATIVLSLGVSSFAAEQPSDGATKLIDANRVTIWDVKWTGASRPATPTGSDWLRVVLDGGDAAAGSSSRPLGHVSFFAKGSAEAVAPSGPGAHREIVVALKDLKVEPLKNTSGQPLAFPRPGIKRILENDRVIVWDYTWLLGKPTPTHFHDKDVVVVYLADGVLASTTLDGKVVDNTHTLGLARFNLRDRVHFETLKSGAARAILTELK